MKIVETIAETRAFLDAVRAQHRSLGFVPTMGYLHDGHASLIRRARAENDAVAVSIFVNPLQFGANEDLAAYPRDLERDAKLCESEGADIVFAPSVAEMYPSPNPFSIVVGDIGNKLCGRTRPGHFDGVATVVAKLFNIAGPCRAYFGAKDAQQLVVIRRLARAFDFPVEVVGCPIVREADGLAMSSRNVYLEPAEREAALVLKRALDEAAAAVRQGERDGRRIAEDIAARISSEPRARLDYAVCADPETLDDVERVEGAALLAVAAWFGKARLIDNMTVTP
jgi:pantoate--beta-alanine ligase